MLGIFDDPTRRAMASAMDACALRNRVIANNIANADTPGFKRSKVDFEDALQDAVSRGQLDDPSAHLEAQVAEDQTSSTRLDGNNVNTDTEMADLARNTIEYNALVELTRLKSQMLTSVISGGTK